MVNNNGINSCGLPLTTLKQVMLHDVVLKNGFIDRISYFDVNLRITNASLIEEVGVDISGLENKKTVVKITEIVSEEASKDFE